MWKYTCTNSNRQNLPLLHLFLKNLLLDTDFGCYAIIGNPLENASFAFPRTQLSKERIRCKE